MGTVPALGSRGQLSVPPIPPGRQGDSSPTTFGLFGRARQHGFGRQDLVEDPEVQAHLGIEELAAEADQLSRPRGERVTDDAECRLGVGEAVEDLGQTVAPRLRCDAIVAAETHDQAAADGVSGHGGHHRAWQREQFEDQLVRAQHTVAPGRRIGQISATGEETVTAGDHDGRGNSGTELVDRLAQLDDRPQIRR